MKVICQLCRQLKKNDYKDDKSNMIRHKNKYYHNIIIDDNKKTCYELQLDIEEKKKKIREQKDKFNETVKRIHEIDVIPNGFYSFYIDKLIKSGATYLALDYTYNYCEKDIREGIRYVKSNNGFKNKQNELAYGLAIAKNKYEDAKEHFKKRKQISNRNKISEHSGYAMAEVKNNTNQRKSKKHEKDISDFLDN